MKEHFQDYGVRKWAGDDLIELQGEPLAALQALVEPYAPCIIQGCEVTENGNGGITVSPGLVALKGKDSKGNACVKIARFAGIESATSIYLTLACETVNRAYGDGKVKDIAYDYKAVASTQRPDEPFLEISGKEVPRLVDTLGITQKLDREGGDASDVKVNFAESKTDTYTDELKSGNPLSKLFGAIKKWLESIKKKLDGIEEGAKVNVQADWSETDTESDAYIRNKPGNATPSTGGLMSKDDKKKLDDIEDNANNYTHPTHNVITGSTEDMAPAFGKTADTYTYNVDSQGHVTGQNTRTIRIPDTVATQSAAGLMSKDDKIKLDGIAIGAQVNTVTSVANKTGAVTLSKSDVGLNKVDNTPDTEKPISTAVRNALEGKANSSHTHSYLPLAGGTMTGNAGIQYPTANGTTKTGNFISAGGGYGTGSGKNGLKLLSFDSSDGQAGMGNDLTGYTYETTLAAAQDTSGNTHITFAKHAANSKTYTRLAEIDGSGNFNAKGQVKENGTRVYSPNNKPTADDIGAAKASHTHDYLPLSGGTITGNLRLKGSGNYGNKLNFGDGEYVYLHEATNDKLTIYSKSGIDFTASSTSQPFNVKGLLQENGTRVYSPNNKPPQATTSAAGLMSAADKKKLDKIDDISISIVNENTVRLKWGETTGGGNTALYGYYYVDLKGTRSNGSSTIIQTP